MYTERRRFFDDKSKTLYISSSLSLFLSLSLSISLLRLSYTLSIALYQYNYRTQVCSKEKKMITGKPIVCRFYTVYIIFILYFIHIYSNLNTGILKGEEFFDDKPILCRIIASLCLNACFTSFFSLFLVTVTQYLFVCHNKAYHKVRLKRCSRIGYEVCPLIKIFSTFLMRSRATWSMF